jgi:hypothetical protein
MDIHTGQELRDLVSSMEMGDWVCGDDVHLDPYQVPVDIAKTRVRWATHPERSVSGVCGECDNYSGQFMSLEQVTGLQPVHPNCVCGWTLSPGNVDISIE